MTSSSEERDIHLREALRYAPDAAERPPASLSEAIRRAARLAAAAPTPPRPASRPGWLAWWDRLAQPRFASVLASVMIATLAGLIWWDQPMDEGMPQAPKAPRSVRAPASSPVALPPVADTTAAAPEVAAAPAPVPTTRSKQARASTRHRGDDAGLPPAAPAAAATPAENAMDAEIAGTPAPDTSSAPPSLEKERRIFGKLDQAPEARRRQEAWPAPHSKALNPQDGLAASGDTSPSTTAAQTARRPAADANALPALRALLPAEATRWTWQLDGAPQGVTPALQDWLARLERGTPSGFAAQPENAAPSAGARDLRLIRDGLLLHRFRLQGTTLWWVRSEGSPKVQRAELPEATARELQSALDALN